MYCLEQRVMDFVEYTQCLRRIVGSGIQFIPRDTPNSRCAVKFDVYREVIFPLLNQRFEALTVRAAVGKVFGNLDNVRITGFYGYVQSRIVGAFFILKAFRPN